MIEDHNDGSEQEAEDLFDALANGEALDWAAVEARGGPALVKRLRAVERLTLAFAEARTDHSAPAAAPLFEWGHLQVLDEIGSGASSRVYRAYDTILARDVALKLRRAEGAGPSSGSAFIEEARRIARVRHPAVLAVLGAAVHGEQAGLWTDLIDGVTLQERIRSQGPMRTDRVLDILETLADALVAVHEAGLVHGDVKAANVMLTSIGRPVLMDFGAGGESLGPTAGASAGSPSSMAPELFEGAPSGIAADMYALGALGYFLATGQPPLNADTLADLSALMAHHHRHIEQALLRVSDRPLRRLLARLLSSTPDARPSASALRAQLAWMRGAPARRKRLAVAVAIIAALSVATLLSSVSYVAAERARKTANSNFERAQNINDFLRSLLGANSNGAFEPGVRVDQVLEPAADEAERAFVDRPEALAAVLFAVGNSYISLGDSKRALPLIRRSLDLLLATHASEPRILRGTRLSLARALRGAGAAEQALNELNALKAELMAEWRANPDSVELKSMLSDVHANLGDLANDRGEIQAEEEEITVALGYRADLPASRENRRLQVLLLAARGGNRRMQGRLEEAEADFRDALDKAKDTFSPSAGVVLSARGGLATLLIIRGEFKAAEAINRELMATLEPLGRSAPRLMATRNNLGLALKEQGRYDEAIDLFESVMTDANTDDTESRAMHLSASDNLANTLRLQGRSADAIDLYRSNLEKKTVLYGDSHPDTLTSAINLAELLVESGNTAEGEALASKAETLSVALFGTMNPYPQEAREILGLARLQRGDAVAARDALLAVLAAKDTIYGQGNPASQPTRLRLALAFEQLGQRQQARPLIETVIAQRQAELGDEHPDTQAARAQLQRLGSGTP